MKELSEAELERNSQAIRAGWAAMYRLWRGLPYQERVQVWRRANRYTPMGRTPHERKLVRRFRVLAALAEESTR